MGFYTPSQLVQDARRHGVEVRRVDVLSSERECTLEAGADASPAVRLGFLLVRGLSQAGAERIVAARRIRPFEGVEDLARRAGLNKHDLKCLAAAGAFEAFSGHQRPGTASGTVFVTLEDETGYVNVIVWPHLIERQRRELLGARLMGVEGVLEREGEVMHLVARRLSDHSALLGSLVTPSRDFH